MGMFRIGGVYGLHELLYCELLAQSFQPFPTAADEVLSQSRGRGAFQGSTAAYPFWR
jgi:hypothetical protein